MNISHYGFSCPVNFWNEKYIRVKNKKYLDISLKKIDIRYSWIICEFLPSDKYYSYSYSQVLEFTNYSYSYLYRIWLRKSIPIPIRRKNYYSLITDSNNPKLVLVCPKFQGNTNSMFGSKAISMLSGVLQPGWMVF